MWWWQRVLVMMMMIMTMTLVTTTHFGGDGSSHLHYVTFFHIQRKCIYNQSHLSSLRGRWRICRLGDTRLSRALSSRFPPWASDMLRLDIGTLDPAQHALLSALCYFIPNFWDLQQEEGVCVWGGGGDQNLFPGTEFFMVSSCASCPSLSHVHPAPTALWLSHWAAFFPPFPPS
jgi:hypothetical protein